jgi:thymidylate kinase
MPTRIISLTGLDGSGKTAHCRQLVTDFVGHDLRCKYLWLRQSNFISLPVLALCRLLKFTYREKLPNGSFVSSHRFGRQPLRTLWPWLRLFDSFCSMALNVWPRTFFGTTVICDRCTFDVLVDVMVETRRSSLENELAGRLLIALTPVESTFLLDIDEAEAMKRKTDIPSIDYLSERRALYCRLGVALGIRKIDAAQPFETVHETLIDYLRSGQK